MRKLPIAFVLLTSLLWSQAKEDGRTAFDKLLAARDPDILDAVKSNYLVCFADKNPEWLANDRFLVVITSEPNGSSWADPRDADVAGEGVFGSKPVFAKQFGIEAVHVWEHEDKSIWTDSFMDGEWRTEGHYTVQSGKRKWVNGSINPVFIYQKKDDTDKLLESITMDDTSFAASKAYANKAKGTTDWNLSIRLSTGRYHETWETDNIVESLGRCYRSKTKEPLTGQRLRCSACGY